MNIQHTSQGVFFEDGGDLVPLAQSEAVRIFGYLEADDSLSETLKLGIIEKLTENLNELVRQVVDFDEVSIDPVMSYISSLINYRAVCLIGYKQYRDSIEEARNQQ